MTVAHRAAVCGTPIGHSLSPVLHTAGFAAAGLLDWTYGAIECTEAGLGELVAGLGPEWVGLSLTMPLKEVALTLAASASPVARAIGAANTLVRRSDGGWYADNTDVPGMVRVLREAGLRPAGFVPAAGEPLPSSLPASLSFPLPSSLPSSLPASLPGSLPAETRASLPAEARNDAPPTLPFSMPAAPAVPSFAAAPGPAAAPSGSSGTAPRTVPPDSSPAVEHGKADTPPTFTVLGGGGTARAALAAAAALGAVEVTVVTRRAEAFDELAPVADALGLKLISAPWAEAPETFTADAVISTVPKGAADHLAPAVSWRRGTVLFDAIYDPWPTPLAAAAAGHGIRIISGLDLLLAQALGQFEHFTGVVPAPEAAMREALFAAAKVR